MNVCAVCGSSEDQRDILAVGYAKGKIRINSMDDRSPVFYICAHGDCISEAKSRDLIGKALGHALKARDYLVVAESMQTSRIKTPDALLGLARKSGSVVMGTEAVIQKIRNRAVFLVLVDPNTSGHTRGKLEREADRFNAHLKLWTGSRSIEQILKKANCKVIGITRPELAKTIQENL